MQTEDIAQILRTAEAERAPIAPLQSMDVIDAYAVQEHSTQFHLTQGRRLVGRKIGLTSQAVQKQLGVEEPDYGMLFADMEYASGEIIPASRLIQPKVEAEIAFVMKQSLDHENITVTDVTRAVGYCVPALEIVDSRIADWKISLGDTVADNASAGVYVLGSQPIALSDFDVETCTMELRSGDDVVATGTGAACIGNPLIALRWLAQTMHAKGRAICEGDVILSGALGAMVPVSRGDVYHATISGLGHVTIQFAKDAAA